MAGDFNTWSFQNQTVDPIGMDGKYINARSTLIAAGPPSFAQISSSNSLANSTLDNGGMVYPIGFIENFGMSQQKNLQRMYEIGSNRAYFVPGRTMSSAQMGRVLFHGPSLLRVLYAYYPQDKIMLPSGVANDDVKTAFTDSACLPVIEDAPGTQSNDPECNKTSSPSFYMNLASTLFDHPLGLMVYMKDINNKYYSAFYLEYCYVTAHSLNINSSSTVIAEGIGLQFDTIQPIDLQT